jgi:AAA domain
MSAYPEGFDAWPPDERNAFFAQEVKAYDERKKANGDGRSHSGNGQWEPPPHYGDRNPPPPGGEAEEPLPKLIPLKRVKGRVREWNVRDWIPKRTPTLLQGDGGLGKSTLLQQWQSSCATNTLWLGLTADSGEAARL